MICGEARGNVRPDTLVLASFMLSDFISESQCLQIGHLPPLPEVKAALLSVTKDMCLCETESFVYFDSSHCTDSMADVMYSLSLLQPKSTLFQTSGS